MKGYPYNECGIGLYEVKEAWQYYRKNKDKKWLKLAIVNFLVVIKICGSSLCGPQGRCCRRLFGVWSMWDDDWPTHDSKGNDV